jgi:hypothetical protein
VKNELSSEARNSAVSATSSGVPALPSGVCPTISIRRTAGIGSVIGVSMRPGQIALARIPRDPASCATDFVNPRIPALAAL